MALQHSLVEKYRTLGHYHLTDLESLHLLEEASDKYYNTCQPIMTDEEYDTLFEHTYKNTPGYYGNPPPIGSMPTNNQKTELPYFMGSMNKIKSGSKDFEDWKRIYKGPYSISCKLDGISCLFVKPHNQFEQKLYTRGTGTIGTDISHLLPFIKTIPLKKKEMTTTSLIVMRGELVISKKTFETKYAKQFKNMRNMVAGILNQKMDQKSEEQKQIYRDIDFVVYEVIEPANLTPIKQFEYLSAFKIKTVWNETTAILTETMLTDLLKQKKTTYDYDIDGLVIYDNHQVYERKSENPKHAFAFKINTQIAEAIISKVLWEVSKDGYLKPRVQIEPPISLGGVLIEYATGFNAKFIIQNKIGPGAKIQLIRSGDVIPYISSIIEPSKMENLYPEDPSIAGKYHWTESGVDLALDADQLSENKTMQIKQITKFFQEIGVNGIGEGNVIRIYNHKPPKGQSIAKILKMTEEDFRDVDGFQTKMAKKLYEGIKEAIQKVTIPQLMVATNIFGRGFSNIKVETIMNALPDILESTLNKTEKINVLLKVPGIASKTATDFVEGIEPFIAFLEETSLKAKLIKAGAVETITTSETSHLLKSKTIVMTGFRNKQLEDKLKQIGAKIGSSVSGSTGILIIKDDTEESKNTTKYKEGLAKKIMILTLSEFLHKHPELTE
jgi:NAD-dependent DNA ligase